MNSTHQVSLFGSGRPTFDARLRRIQRVQLDNRAWVDYQDAWLDGHECLFEMLADEAQWRTEERRMYDQTVAVPRLRASCPRGDGGATLRRMSLALSVHYGKPLSSISLNWYRDGEDSVAMHADRMGERVGNTAIAIVSVGQPRRFNLRPVAGGRGHSYYLGWGDLLVMGGNCQETWQHGVPKTAHAEPRISIVFREPVDAILR